MLAIDAGEQTWKKNINEKKKKEKEKKKKRKKPLVPPLRVSNSLVDRAIRMNIWKKERKKKWKENEKKNEKKEKKNENEHSSREANGGREEQRKNKYSDSIGAAFRVVVLFRLNHVACYVFLKVI